MRLGEIDLGGWARLVGAVVLCTALAWVFGSTLAGGPLAVVAPAAIGFGLLIAVVVVVSWARYGGYQVHRAVQRWIRGGPEPVGVPAAKRVRALSQFIDRTGWYGWLAVAAAAIFTVDGLLQLAGRSDWRAVLLALLPATIWAGNAINALVIERRWRPRAKALYEEELQTASWTDLPPL
ncbi:hypothetical protein [Curtobacterium pusillum]|uniref:hypothetical protein n=1 Tax=Curtobacterium pusillum TaxID=69373 RepID=UPI0011A851FB|nr:hypothetical protein [Curtobacterium pusillum]